MSTLRILLLQARNADDAARFEEHTSFAQMAGMATTQVVPFDILSSVPTIEKVRQYDALMVGGSGDYYVSKKNLPFHQAMLDLLAEVVTVGQPTFASCFGFQLLVQAMGGNIIYDPANTEVGTFTITLTPAGSQDELFSFLPTHFQAQLGRKDRAEYLPPTAIHLAGSQSAPYQAIRVPNAPIWATQFHPELTRDTNLSRFNRYVAGYAAVMDEGKIAKTRARFDHSPEANNLLREFIKLVFS